MISTPADCSLLHVLVSLRAEGTPRLALELLREEKRREGSVGHVAFLHPQLRDLEPRFRELGVPLHELPWKRRRFDRLLVQMLGLLRKIRPRGVIAYPLGAHVPIAAASRLLGIPCVVHVGNTPPAHLPRSLKILRWQMLAGLPFVRRYVCCSDCVRDLVHEHYSVPSRKTVRVYNGIQMDRFLAVRDQRVFNGRQILKIGMVASLEPSKDHATLLQAAAVLHRRGEPFLLRLLGDGSLRASLQDQAERLGIRNQVEFAGVVDPITTALADLDVFAFSATPDEGMGIALVEALAAGLPCVGSNVVACREVLRGGELGVIVPSQDPQLWADAILQARNKPAVPACELAPFHISTTYDQYWHALFGNDASES